MYADRTPGNSSLGKIHFTWTGALQKFAKSAGGVMQKVTKIEHKIGKPGVALLNPVKFIHEKVTEDWAINHLHHEAYIHAMKYWPSWAKKNIRWIFPTAYRHRRAHGYTYSTDKGPVQVSDAQADTLFVHDRASGSWLPVGDVQGAANDGVPEAKQLIADMEAGTAITLPESALLASGLLPKATPENVKDANEKAQQLPPPSDAAKRGEAVIAQADANKRKLWYVAGAFALAKMLALI